MIDELLPYRIKQIFERGDRMIACASGELFELIAQIPGAIAGDLTGVIFGLLKLC